VTLRLLSFHLLLRAGGLCMAPLALATLLVCYLYRFLAFPKYPALLLLYVDHGAHCSAGDTGCTTARRSNSSVPSRIKRTSPANMPSRLRGSAARCTLSGAGRGRLVTLRFWDGAPSRRLSLYYLLLHGALPFRWRFFPALLPAALRCALLAAWRLLLYHSTRCCLLPVAHLCCICAVRDCWPRWLASPPGDVPFSSSSLRWRSGSLYTLYLLPAGASLLHFLPCHYTILPYAGAGASGGRSRDGTRISRTVRKRKPATSSHSAITRSVGTTPGAAPRIGDPVKERPALPRVLSGGERDAAGTWLFL